MIKRYSVGHKLGHWDDDICMEEDNYGDYVSIDDYETLAAEFDSLKDKYDRLVIKLGDLYQES